MQLLKRNQQLIQYMNYSGSMSAITDSEGNYTGEYTETYTALKSVMGYVTPSKGEATEEMFGKDLDYDKILYVDKSCDMDEFSLLWVNTNSSAANDYIVSKIAESLNHKAIAIKKVR